MPYRLCRHIKTDGLQCQSPAMKNQPLCYYHGLYRHRMQPSWTPNEVEVPIVDNNGKTTYHLATSPSQRRYAFGHVEDFSSIQVAVSSVLNALAGNGMDLPRATALLYGLRLASLNLRHVPGNGAREIASDGPDCTENGAISSENPVSSSTARTCAQVPPNDELGEDVWKDFLQNEELDGTIERKSRRLRLPYAERIPTLYEALSRKLEQNETHHDEDQAW